MPDQMSFDIQCADGLKQATMSPRDHKGTWVSLGTYEFEQGFRNYFIRLEGARSQGPLFADALLLVPRDK